MTEEKMQGEARQAFLVDTLQKLLGQDSPTGFTERVVTVAEEIARELGITTKTVEYHIRTALAELRKIIAAIIVFF